MQWLMLFQKELLEKWHNKMWIWVPLVFILFALMDPVTYYFLPEIMEYVGGTPEGFMFQLPDIHAEEALMMSLEQISLFGLIVVGLITMGAIAGERKTGSLEMIMTKPVRYAHYITSKWVAYALLIFGSFTLAMMFSAYYIIILYGSLSLGSVVGTILIYSVWLLFVLSLSIFFNSFVRTPGVVFACTIATVVVLKIVYTIFGHKLTMLPNALSEHLSLFIAGDPINSDLVGTICVTFALIILLIISANFLFEKSEKV